MNNFNQLPDGLKEPKWKQSYKYIIRRFIGAEFAQFEIKIILAQILQRTSLTLPDNYKLKLVRMGIGIAPADYVPVTVRQKLEQVEK